MLSKLELDFGFLRGLVKLSLYEFVDAVRELLIDRPEYASLFVDKDKEKEKDDALMHISGLCDDCIWRSGYTCKHKYCYDYTD